MLSAEIQRSVKEPKGMAKFMTKLSVGLEQAEEMTGISHHTFRKLVRKGKIKAARVGRRIVIPIGELERLVKPGANLPSTSK